ncbi:MAG: DUF58 domain-containing protein [Solirubrobacteraceae bacterium]
MTEPPPPRPDRVTETTQLRWTHSPGLAAGAGAALLLGAIGLIAARIDVALLSLPLIVAIALSWDRRPAAQQSATATLSLVDAGSSEVAYSLDLAAPRAVEMIVVRHSVLGGEAREVVVAGWVGSIGDLSGTVPLLHSGPQELVRFDYRFLSTDAAAASIPQDPIVGERVVAPSQKLIRSLPLPRRLQGLTGPHESARAGDGGEFRDIHPFTVGDRLRRIDWKATARRGQSAGDLYVRRTNALADATVLIVMDSRDDVGEQVREWSRNVAVEKGVSSLDIAREAASSIASAYIAAGDRVGFQDLSSRARMVAHAGGRRHLWRLLRVIDLTAPSSVAFRHRRPPIVPPGALVYLLSSLLDDQALSLALTWLGNGHRVIAVDVLPPARFARTNRYERVAHRMVLMGRDDRVRLLRMRGVEVLRWSEEAASLPLAARLQLLARPVRRRGSRGARR